MRSKKDSDDILGFKKRLEFVTVAYVLYVMVNDNIG